MRSLIVALTALFLALPAFSVTDTQLITDGKAAMRRGDADEAAKLFEQAVAMKPNVAEYHYRLGTAYGAQAQKAGMFGGFSLAKKTKGEFERAVQLDPNYLEARLALVDFYSMAPGIAGGSDDKALEQAAEIKKHDALEGHRAFGRIYNRQKKFDLARKEYVEAVREQPNSPKTHYYLGNFLASQKDWSGSLHEYEYALKLDPKYMPAWFRIGVHATQSESNYARGEEGLRKYLGYTPAEDEPSLASAWYYLGMVQEKTGRKADAKQSYLNAQKLAPTSKEIEAALKRVS
ncbi:MAG TPA: tetratricopeptide repeat protein [Gemmatimonadaceae bacterium]|nr:tetratricopeptide repeat protein [Gemmatimonadaceae bacterium]